MRKVLRSLYLDQEIDEALAARAEQERTTKAELMRAYIALGLNRPARSHARKVEVEEESEPEVVRVRRAPL